MFTYNQKNKKGLKKIMEAIQGQGGIESVTMSEILGLDTWNQPRDSEQLQSFINRRHEALQIDDSEQDFDL